MHRNRRTRSKQDKTRPARTLHSGRSIKGENKGITILDRGERTLPPHYKSIIAQLAQKCKGIWVKFSIFCGYFSDFALKNTIYADWAAREGFFRGAPQLCCGAPSQKVHFFSLRRLSLMMVRAASSMSVMPSSLAISTICCRAAFKKTRGILVSLAQAPSVNLTSGSMRSAA